VNIHFKNKEIEELCNIQKMAVRRLGAICAKILRRRLDSLQAASSLAVMKNLPGKCHELIGDRKGQLSLDLEQPLRLIFEAVGENIHREDTGLDWALVKSVRILGIEDTHE
jgi:proteic killer suppression protein